MEFSERLKQLRKEKDFTQEELANKLGITAGAVGLYEQGRREPDNSTVKKLAQMFDVSTDYLLGMESIIKYDGENDDDFTYALYQETKNLTDTQKEALLNMARALKESNK